MEPPYIDKESNTTQVKAFTLVIQSVLIVRNVSNVYLCRIGPNYYNTGENIIGDIEALVWTVVKCVRMGELAYKEIETSEEKKDIKLKILGVIPSHPITTNEKNGS